MDSSSVRSRLKAVLGFILVGTLILAPIAVAATSAYFLVATRSRIVATWPLPLEADSNPTVPERSSKTTRRAADPALFKEREMAASSITQSMDEDPQCIIVLGARAYRDATPSPALARRLERTLELYDAGAAPSICITGDGRADSDPETNAMRLWFLARGVNEKNIIVDSGGYTTFISMRNLAHLGISSAIVVTQDYHLPRAIYDAEDQGIEIRGVPAAQHRRNKPRTLLREALARVKTLWITTFD